MKQNINNYEFIEPGSGTMPADDNSGAPPAAMPSPKPKKPAIVTKEELAKSGMSLRDYMNKQQGLTRRKEKNPTPKLIDPSNIRSGVRFDDEGLIDPRNIRSGAGMKSGGSVSSASRRADGIATKGKTNCKMR